MNSTKPPKPYPSFPLFAHSKGYWAAKICARHVSFGKWAWPDRDAYESSWRSALERYKKYSELVAVGGIDAAMLTVPDMVNSWRTKVSKRCLSREISARHAADCMAVAAEFSAAVGNVRIVELERRPALLAKFTAKIGGLGWHGYNRRIAIVKAMFAWAKDPIEGPLKRTFQLADALEKRPVKLLRRHKREREADRGKACWTPAEFSALVACASPITRAWLLLSYFCAYGNSDIADLPRSAISELPDGWGVIHFPRPKTEIERAAVVPPLVMDALREAAPLRARPADSRWAGLCFLTVTGLPLVRESIELDVAHRIDRIGKCDRVSQDFYEFRKSVWHCPCGLGAARNADGAHCLSCRTALVPIRSLGFYAGRHMAITAVSALPDQDAQHRWRGHSLRGMSDTYIEEIEVPRLRAVADRLLAKLPGLA